MALRIKQEDRRLYRITAYKMLLTRYGLHMLEGVVLLIYRVLQILMQKTNPLAMSALNECQTV